MGKEEKGKHETSPSVRQPISQATKNVSVLEKKKPLPLLVDETQARLEIGLVSLSWRCHVETISSFSLELFRVPSRWHLIFAFKFISDSFALFSLRPHHTHTHSRRRTIHKWPAMSGRGRRPLFFSLLFLFLVLFFSLSLLFLLLLLPSLYIFIVYTQQTGNLLSTHGSAGLSSRLLPGHLKVTCTGALHWPSNFSVAMPSMLVVRDLCLDQQEFRYNLDL